MRPLKRSWRFGFILSSLFAFLTASVRAQENQGPSPRSTTSPAKPSAAAKGQPLTARSAASQQQASNENFRGQADGPEAIRKREEWFYKQRSSVNGHIPAGARLKAFQHMQRMMLAEGKLVPRPDGSYAEVTPQSWLSPLGAVTSTWTSVGPTPTTGGFFSPVTGRVTTIAVDPSDSTGNTVLIGGAMGGIWRSTDAGTTWTAVGDQNASLAMGSIAFAPSQPAIVYAGTGEQASVGFDIYYGAGVLKSADHGQTWTQTCMAAGPTCPFIGPYLDSLHPGFGFFNLGGARISYIAINPQNPNLVLVAAQLGIEGPTEGIYCSSDGGARWANIFPDEMATFVGFASPTVAFAAFGMPFGSSPNAPHGNGIYKSTNANSCSATFTPLTTGLPAQSSIGRIDLGIASNDTTGNTVYASIANSSNGSSTNLGVFLTTSGGSSWTQTSAPDVCQPQCWYDNVIKVDPNNRNMAFFGGSAVTDPSGNPNWVVRTTNSGGSWTSVIPNLPGGSPGLPHVDSHAIAFGRLPTGRVRMYLGNDGGVWRTDDAEATTVTWTNLNNPSLTLTQFYPSISTNASSPSIAFGGTQDNGSQNYQGGLSWVDNQLCGDGASTAVDSIIPSTVYIGCATGFPVNASYQNGTIGTFSPAVNGINPGDIANFITPLVSDPNLPNVVYFGANTVYESVDAANTWAPISGNIGSPSNGIINTLAIGSNTSSVIYAGLSNGTVEVENNANSGSFANFSPVMGQASLPSRSVTAIAVDGADSSGKTAYVAYSGFSYVGADALNPTITINDPQGHIFKTTDEGNTWLDISCSVSPCTNPAPTDLPNIPVNDLVIDPDLPGVLYAATDLGVFVGNCTVTPCAWTTLSTGLPRAAVLSLRLHEPSRTLRAATHGRGVWDINLNNFSFTGPHISSINPSSANAGASSSLTLTVNGSGLTGGTVNWNGSATNVTTTQVSDTQLTATIAPSLLASAGTPKITVVNGTQTSNALTFSVLAATPTIAGVSPSSTPVQSTPSTPQPIQLTGTNFSSNAKVLFNGTQNGITITAPTASCPLPTCLTATLPAALLGPYGSTNDIAVLNMPPGGGRSKPVQFRVTASPPPNDNFANAINITTLTFHDVQDSSEATTESADPTPPCAQQYTSAQGNSGGHPNGVYNTIWYKFTPLFSANLTVDLSGSSYDTVVSIWTGSVGSLTSIACNDDINPGIILQSQLQNVPLTAGTTYYIMVSSFGPPDPNPLALGGLSNLNFLYNNGFYPTPTLASINPTSASSGGQGFTLTVNGTGFLNGASVEILTSELFDGYTPEPTTFVSSTQLTAAIPASAIVLPGPASVVVANPQPTIGTSNALNFVVNVGTYPVPDLTTISPTSVLATTLGTTIDAGGDLFAPNAVLNFNGVPENTTVVNPRLLVAVIPASQITLANVGTVQVTVSNPTPGGGTSSSLPFTIVMPNPIPTITSISPNSASANQQNPLPINIVGTNFQQGAIATFNGFSMQTTLVSATQITMTVSTNFLTNAGTFPIVVIDPAPGGTSNAVNFTVTPPPPPTISSVSPSSGQSGSSVPITITGTNFQQGATVSFNGTNYGTTLSGSTQLATVLQLGGVAAGTYPLSVVDPAPTGPSAPYNFNVTDFSLTSSGTTTQSVNAGQTATFTNAITASAGNGFNAQVNLSCSLPIAATHTTCAVNPNTFATGSGTASVSVTTMARGIVPPSVRFYLPPQWAPLFLLTLILAIVFLRLARTRWQRLASALPLAALALFLVLQAMGCGGGSGYTPPPPPTGTPAGTYTVTVTGTSGSTTHSASLTLVVN